MDEPRIDQSVYEYVVPPERLRSLAEKEVQVSLEEVTRVIRRRFLDVDQNSVRDLVKLCASQSSYLYHAVQTSRPLDRFGGGYVADFEQVFAEYVGVLAPLKRKIDDLKQVCALEKDLEMGRGAISELLQDPRARAKLRAQIEAMEVSEGEGEPESR